MLFQLPKIPAEMHVTHLNARVNEQRKKIIQSTTSKIEFLKFNKQLAKEAKQRKKNNNKVYVIDFKGDVQASAVSALREEITLILSTAKAGQDRVVIRLESPAGSTDLWVLLDNGDVEMTQKPATTVSLLNDLHRGKNVGAAWHWLIDISAIIIILLSLAGYILFLTIKTRLVTHLLLTACSLSAIILLIWSAI